jgi:hypothetical protein
MNDVDNLEKPKIYFSKSENGFFRDDIHEKMPEDIVEITSEQHKMLLDGQSAGKIITGDIDGHPCLIDRPPPTEGQKWLRIKMEVVRLLNDTDYVMLIDVPVANIEDFKKYRKELRDISSKFSKPEDVVWPEKPTYRAY